MSLAKFKNYRFYFLACYIILHELNVLPNHQGGFYCKDPKLSFPFEGDTISITSLLVVGIILPVVVMFGFEMYRYRPEKYTFSNIRYRAVLKNTYIWYGEYLLSLIFSLFFMEVIKGIIGEPRPHFFDTCSPDKAVNCTPGTYITDYVCTNTKHSKWFVKDTVKSFPSGHTMLGFVLGLHLFFYFQKRVCDLAPRLLGPCLQMICISWTIVCSLSRVTDNRHHWWDVLAGAVLGVIMAYYNIAVLCNNFKCTNPKLARASNGNPDGSSVDNHNNIKRLSFNTTSVRQENFDGLRQIT